MKYTVSNAEKNEMFYKGDVINDVTPKRGPTVQGGRCFAFSTRGPKSNFFRKLFQSIRLYLKGMLNG